MHADPIGKCYDFSLTPPMRRRNDASSFGANLIDSWLSVAGSSCKS